jgi:Uracil-DNA glycosylase
MNLTEVRKEASTCTLCDLHKTRLKPVFGKWNENADVVVCGMCPGPDENISGLPFVGRAGKVLDEVIVNSKFGATSTTAIYITNLVKCFVQPGIKLRAEWMDHCLPYFILQLQLIKPKVIIGLGGDICNFLLGTELTVGELRKSVCSYMNYSFISSFHPSFLVRGGGTKHTDFPKSVDDFNVAYKIIH